MATGSPNASPSWPPASLFGADVSNLLSLTESMEATGSLDPVTLQLLMAALLFLGDSVACRHLWRRHVGNEELRAQLQPWWKVGAAMQATQGPALFAALQDLEVGTAAAAATTGDGGGALGESSASSPASIPLAQYARDIAQSYRTRMLLPFVAKGQTPPSFLAPTLGFQTPAECADFCQHTFGNLADRAAANGGNALTPAGLSLQQQAALISFLESQMAV